MLGANMDQSFTLDSVYDEFNQWRSTRTKQGRIPDNLWAKAIHLLEHHSMTEISRSLRVSHEQITAKLNQYRSIKSENNIIEESSPFVEVSLPSIKHEQTDIQLGSRIELKRADGASMIIEHLSDQALTNLLATFMRDL